MSDDERLENALRRLARELDPPPPAPREEMWAAITRLRADAGNADAAADEPGAGMAGGPAGLEWRRRRLQQAVPTLSRLPAWVRWVPALAAMLVLGIGIGRIMQPASPRPAAETQISADVGQIQPGVGYEHAALTHLTSAEALLVAFPEDARAGRTEVVAGWARELLTDTRLLADSPVSDDPEVARLLDDLELLLAQIAALDAPARGGDVELIKDGIRHNDVLLRLRTATGSVAAGL